MPAMTKAQQKAYNYLSAEAQRQKGTLHERTSFPCFILNCCGCFVELRTSVPKNAQQFIKEHQGHKAFSLEINQRPNAVVYDREKILAQLAKLGHYVVANHIADGIVVRETRTTYKAIRSGIDIEGALERLLSVYKTKKLADIASVTWLQAIIYQDQKFIESMEK